MDFDKPVQYQARKRRGNESFQNMSKSSPEDTPGSISHIQRGYGIMTCGSHCPQTLTIPEFR
jgi:hypothetical protein